MTSLELTEIVNQRMADPHVLGRLACNLRTSDGVQQRHEDGRQLRVEWEDAGDYWRCLISSEGSSEPYLARVDLHENGTVRMESFEPCRVTVSPEEGILCLTRYKAQ